MTDRLISKNSSIYKRIIIYFLLMQPLLDLLTSLSVRFTSLEILSLGLVFRTLFMVGIGLYVFFQKGKEYNAAKIYYLVVGAYLIAFLLRIYMIGESELITFEVKSLIKAFYYPIVLIGLWLINKKENLIESNNLFKWIFAQYLIIIFFATISGTSFKSYKHGFGSVGWFYAANEKSAIIAILLSSIFLPLIMKKWNIINILLFGLLIFSVFYVGTKAPPLGLIIFLVGMIVVAFFRLLYKVRNSSINFSKVLIATLLLSAALFFYSPLAKNLVSSYGRFFIGQDELIVGEMSEEELEKEREDKEIVQAILNNRNIYRDFVRESYNESDLSGKLLGIGYHLRDNEGNITDKTIEMDFYDIFFRYGILGTIVYFLPTFLMALYLLLLFFRGFRKNVTSYVIVALSFSVLIGFAVGMISGHVLTSPPVSIFTAVMITTLYSSLKGRTYRIE